MNLIKNETIERHLNKAIILLCFLEVAILKWLNLHTYGGYIIDILVLTSIFLCFKKYDIKTLIISIIICIYILLSYLLFGGTLKNTIANIRDIFPVLLIINFVIYLLRNYNIYEYFNKLFIPINIYMLLNIIALILETNGSTYLSGIRVFYGLTFSYSWDSISGLFGIYGVVLVAFYSVFVLFYNLIYFKYYFDNKYKLSLGIYNSLLLIFTLIISSVNDNKMYYIFLLMFVFLYIVYSCVNKFDTRKTLKVMLLIFLICIFVFIIAYNCLSFFKGYINKLLNVLSEGIDPETMYTDGGGERLGLLIHFVKYLNPLFGSGMGNLRWTKAWGLGFKHFGVSDLGTILCMGGFILLLLYLLLFYFLFKYISDNKLIRLITLLITIIIMFGTQIIANISAIVLYILILLTINWNNKINYLK